MNNIKKAKILKSLNKDNSKEGMRNYPFIEDLYQTYYHNRLSSFIQISLLFSILLLSIFSLVDFIKYPREFFLKSFTIKTLVITPLLSYLYYYSKNNKFHKNFQNRITFFGIIIIISLGINILLYNSHGYYYDHERILIVCVAIYSMTGLESKRALLTSLILTMFFIFSNYIYNMGSDVFYNSLLTLFIINIMGYSYAFLRDFILRNEFIKNSLISFYAEHDPLTNLLNRRTIIINYNNIDVNSKVWYVLIDIDHFKKYNDTYGHIEGDNCLVKFSNLLLELSNDKTFISRYGGEEFLLISTEDDFDKKVYKLQESLRILDIDNEKSTYGKLTISVGMSSFIKSGNSEFPYYINETDKLLYEAKESGRNKILYKSFI